MDMRGRSKGILVCIALLTVGATAQTTQSTGNPAVFIGGSQVGSGEVGIGAINNTQYDPLIAQSIFADGGGIGMIGVVVPAEGDYAFAESDYWLNNANATTPNVFLWAFGSEGYYGDDGTVSSQDAYIFDALTRTYNFAVDGGDNVYVGGGIGSSTLYAGINGNVGVGTATPGARLEVNGNILMTTGSGGTITFPDGTVQTTAFTGASGGDFAESVDVTGSRAKYQPGDVLVIDPNSPGRFLKSVEPYSTSVSGIYSTKPGNVGRRQTTPRTADEVPMAMMGIVPTNVTAENGPIKPGDLLVTSSTLGYAMKGTDRGRMLGAVIGKALGSLDSGKGVIEVVVTLQ